MSELGAVRRACTSQQRAAIVEKCRRCCTYCEREGTTLRDPDGRDWHIDHVVALAKGGTNDESNLTLACKQCNLDKGIRDYAEFKAAAMARRHVEGDLSPLALEKIERLVTDATPGRPWLVTPRNSAVEEWDVIVGDGSASTRGWSSVGTFFHHWDALLAAESVVVIPQLIAEIRRLRELLAVQEADSDHSEQAFLAKTRALVNSFPINQGDDDGPA